MSWRLEQDLRDALIDIFEENTVIKAASYPVMSINDNTKEKSPAVIGVEVKPAEPIAPGFPAYRVECDIHAVTLIDEDESGAVLDILFNAVNDVAKSLTKTSLATASGLDIDGIIHLQGDSNSTDSINQKTVKFNVFISYQ